MAGYHQLGGDDDDDDVDAPTFEYADPERPENVILVSMIASNRVIVAVDDQVNEEEGYLNEIELPLDQAKALRDFLVKNLDGL